MIRYTGAVWLFFAIAASRYSFIARIAALLGGAERWQVWPIDLVSECADVGLSGQHGDPSAPAATESAALATYGAIACFMRLIACVVRASVASIRSATVTNGAPESLRSPPKTFTRPRHPVPRRRWRWPVLYGGAECVRTRWLLSPNYHRFFITLAGEFDQPGENLGGQELPFARPR